MIEKKQDDLAKTLVPFLGSTGIKDDLQLPYIRLPFSFLYTTRYVIL